MNVVLTQRAIDDLSGIQRFIGQDNPKRAETFVEELLDACYGLSTMPLAFPLVPRYERQGVRRRLHNAYLMFYRVKST